MEKAIFGAELEVKEEKEELPVAIPEAPICISISMESLLQKPVAGPKGN